MAKCVSESYLFLTVMSHLMLRVALSFDAQARPGPSSLTFWRSCDISAIIFLCTLLCGRLALCIQRCYIVSSLLHVFCIPLPRQQCVCTRRCCIVCALLHASCTLLQSEKNKCMLHGFCSGRLGLCILASFALKHTPPFCCIVSPCLVHTPPCIA